MPKGKKMKSPHSNFIRESRKQQKMSQRQLAEKAGVGVRFIRELEYGKQSVRLDKVNQVLAVFGHKLGVIELSDE